MQKKIEDLAKEAENNRMAADILGEMIQKGDAVQNEAGMI